MIKRNKNLMQSKESRTWKSVKNISVSIIFRLFQTLLPFITRTLIIHEFGIEYTGISGLFGSIIGMLSLTDMGMANALNYALYRPIQDKDIKKTNEILSFYRKAYTVIGIIILGMGLCFVPFLKNLIKEGTYPNDLNLNILYIEYLINTVSTYLLFAYKNALLEANQLGYKSALVRVQMIIVQYLIQIGVLVLFNNYYAYVSVLPICTMITCLLISRLSDSIFKENRPEGKLDKKDAAEIFGNVKAGFFYKIGTIIYNSGDGIVISWYLGARVLGIYNSYNYVLSALFSILNAIYSAIIPSIGNSMVTDTKDKNYHDFMIFTYLYNWIIAWCMICLLCLFQPFIELWIGKEYRIGYLDVILFALYFYVFRMRDIVGCYKDAAGLWKVDQYRPLLGGIVNIILNVVLIPFIGITGVLLASIITVVMINFPLSLKVILDYFHADYREYIFIQGGFFVTAVISAMISVFVCTMLNKFEAIYRLIFSGVICMILPNLILLLLNRKNPQFKAVILYVRKKLYAADRIKIW